MSETQGQQVDANDIINALTGRIADLSRELAVNQALIKAHQSEIEKLKSSGKNSR